GAQSFILLRDLRPRLEGAGLLRNDDLTPRAVRKIGASALADVYSALRKGLAGEHEMPDYGAAMPRPDETRPWEFGDPLDLDIVKTIMNGVRRRSAEPGKHSGRVALSLDDFEIREMDYSTETTTVLLLDLSWSMSWQDRFPAAKRVALAMDQLIRTRFPRDHFSVVGFSTRARELQIKELPEICWDMGDPFTNLQEGLMVAERLIGRHRSASPQIIVITDGQPTAYYQEGQLRVEWPMGMGGISPHAVSETLKQVKRITRMGITINTFMLDDAPELVGFVEHMTKINQGRAFYTRPHQLGSFLMVDYLSERRRRRR
ncbi:MAG: VWA domain-containing protein, partial [Planctomycetes bacterium]|nr:VWA domain-containing protein [Planctomycetota bacterium]